VGSLRIPAVPVSHHNCGSASGGPQDRLWWQCHLAESCPILPQGIFIPGPRERCRANPALPASLEGPCLACSPLCSQVTRCASAGPCSGPPGAACPSASTAARQAPPDLSQAGLCPRSGCRSARVVPGPRGCSMPPGRALPAWRWHLRLWLLVPVLPPLLGAAPARQPLAGECVAGKQCNGFVALFVSRTYRGTITRRCVPAWLVMRR